MCCVLDGGNCAWSGSCLLDFFWFRGHPVSFTLPIFSLSLWTCRWRGPIGSLVLIDGPENMCSDLFEKSPECSALGLKKEDWKTALAGRISAHACAFCVNHGREALQVLPSFLAFLPVASCCCFPVCSWVKLFFKVKPLSIFHFSFFLSFCLLSFIFFNLCFFQFKRLLWEGISSHVRSALK